MPDSIRGPNRIHDLRNQLGVILGFCDLVLDHPAPAAMRADLLEIRKAAVAALALLAEPLEGRTDAPE